MITVHWNILVFAIITVIFAIRIAIDHEDDFIPGMAFLIYLIFVIIWGGIFWW